MPALQPNQLFCDNDYYPLTKWTQHAKWSAQFLEEEHYAITKKIVEIFFRTIDWIRDILPGCHYGSKVDYHKQCRVEYALLNSLKIHDWKDIYNSQILWDYSKQKQAPIRLDISGNNPIIVLQLNERTKSSTEDKAVDLTLTLHSSNQQWTSSTTATDNYFFMENVYTKDKLLNPKLKKLLTELTSGNSIVYPAKDWGNHPLCYTLKSQTSE